MKGVTTFGALPLLIACWTGQSSAQTLPSVPTAPTPSTPTTTSSAADAMPRNQGGTDAAFGDIIVTASKRSDSLQRVPLAVSAIGGDALARSPITNLSDIQTSIPNINISARNSSGVVNIRGIGFDIVTAGAESSVAVHSDGVYLSRPTSALASLFDLERIEVARGPQGTLYGRNATGGAVNLISRRPSNNFGGYVNLTAGNYGAVAVEGAITGPIVDGVLSARIAAKVDEHDGYGTNYFNGRGIDDLKSRALRGSLLFTPAQGVSFLLIGDYYRRDDSSFPAHFGGCDSIVCNANAAVSRGYTVPANIRDVNNDVQPINDVKTFGFSLTSTFDLNFATLTGITAYRKGATFFKYDWDASTLPGPFLTREENYKTFSQELQLGNRSGRLDWLLGLYYFHERNNARANGQFASFLAPAFTTYFQGGILTTDAYAAFGEGTYHLNDKFAVTVGARYSKEDKRIDDEFTYTRGPAFIIARQAVPTSAISCVVCRGLPNTASFDSFTPKFGAQYTPDSQRMIYVTVQKGFKSGGFAAGATTPSFDPETIWSYEAGLKATWLDRRLVTNISVYHYDYSSLQVGQVVGTATLINNAAKAKVDGIEGEAKLKLGSHVEVDAHGAYNHARFAAFSSANANVNISLIRDLSGNLLSNAPKLTGALGIQYHTPALGGEVTLRGDVFGSSRVYFSPFNTLLNNQAPYALENLTARYEKDKWFVSVFVNNLSDRTVRSGSYVQSTLLGGFINMQLLPPRTLGGKVGFSF